MMPIISNSTAWRKSFSPYRAIRLRILRMPFSSTFAINAIYHIKRRREKCRILFGLRAENEQPDNHQDNDGKHEEPTSQWKAVLREELHANKYAGGLLSSQFHISCFKYV